MAHYALQGVVEGSSLLVLETARMPIHEEALVLGEASSASPFLPLWVMV